MNCEKCKNKKATVFYADDSGGQHALCAVCAHILGKIAHRPSSSDEDAVAPPFSPTSSLFSLKRTDYDPLSVFYSSQNENNEGKCPFCSTSLVSIKRSGRVGCPDCYSVFGEMLFPSVLNVENAIGARMPRRRRIFIEQRRNIASLKKRLRAAVEVEDFELAATLRDEIRKLDIQGVGGK